MLKHLRWIPIAAAILCAIPAAPAAAAPSGGPILRIGKFDLARGDKLDVVELRNGDQFHGTLLCASYRIHTDYGTFDFPAEKVVAILSLARSGNRQLLVSADAQALSGRIEPASIAMEIAPVTPASGGPAAPAQKIEIPLADIVRLGYRSRAGERDPAIRRPDIVLRGGDVLDIVPPAGTIEMTSRYGTLTIPAQHILSIDCDAANPLPQVLLDDGSRLGVLLDSQQLAIQLAALSAVPTTQPHADALHFTPGTILRMTFRVADPPAPTAALKLANDDLLAGDWAQNIKLRTEMGTLSFEPAQIGRITRSADRPSAPIHLTLTNGVVYSGDLEDPVLSFRLATGAALSLPADVVRTFTRAAATSGPSTTPASHATH